MDQTLVGQLKRTARRLKVSRSALIRDALLRYLRRSETDELEEADRRGYERVPESATVAWNSALPWPDEN
jgi:metal-responsive CopG/Arc/MetJ family transcriptional regulator